MHKGECHKGSTSKVLVLPHSWHGDEGPKHTPPPRQTPGNPPAHTSVLCVVDQHTTATCHAWQHISPTTSPSCMCAQTHTISQSVRIAPLRPNSPAVGQLQAVAGHTCLVATAAHAFAGLLGSRRTHSLLMLLTAGPGRPYPCPPAAGSTHSCWHTAGTVAAAAAAAATHSEQECTTAHWRQHGLHGMAAPVSRQTGI